jgi:Flp pilus assembly protein protease CpaA
MYFQLVALFVCIAWAAFVVQRDLRSYRITNASLTLGLALVWPSLFMLDQRFQISSGVLVISTTALLAGLVSFIGMGDVKLVLFLAPWLHYENFNRSLFLLVLISWLQLIVLSRKHRCFPQRIAFAPAILLAAALNMAT